MTKNLPTYVLGFVLLAGLAAPLATGASQPGFYVEVLLGGLMAGVLYSLVALGFVLIFKASGVLNFAQGAMVLFAALAMEPQVLLLDEPMAGMNLEEKQDMSRFVLDINDEFGTTVVLIEHDMGVVMDISDRVVVLDYGKKIGDGTPQEVRNNPDVISAYLGTTH